MCHSFYTILGEFSMLYRVKKNKCTSPVFQSKQSTQMLGDKWRNAFHVKRAHPCGQQRLMGITKCRVHQQQALVASDFLGKSFWSFLEKHITPAFRERMTCNV